jgi:hypothetical protein
MRVLVYRHEHERSCGRTIALIATFVLFASACLYWILTAGPSEYCNDPENETIVDFKGSSYCCPPDRVIDKCYSTPHLLAPRFIGLGFAAVLLILFFLIHDRVTAYYDHKEYLTLDNLEQECARARRRYLDGEDEHD